MLPNPQSLIEQIANRLNSHLDERGIQDPCFIGIHTGGVWVANALLKTLGQEEQPLGVLNVPFYRDDFSRKGLHPQVRPSQLPFDIENRPDIVGQTLTLPQTQRVK